MSVELLAAASSCQETTERVCEVLKADVESAIVLASTEPGHQTELWFSVPVDTAWWVGAAQALA